MGGPVVGAWEVRWHEALEPEPLVCHLADRGGVAVTGRLCPRCGSSEHGAPWATVDGVPVEVSLARCGPHVVTVVADVPVGVDVEDVAEVVARWQPDLVLAPGEVGDDPAYLWAAKEAVLKLLRVGLDRPMTSVLLADYALTRIDAPAGYVAVVAAARA